MAKAKAKSKSKSKAVVKVASFAPNAKVLAHAKALLKKDEMSKCEVVRATAKRFASVRRGEVEATFVKGLKMNLGTVRRQIQEARA